MKHWLRRSLAVVTSCLVIASVLSIGTPAFARGGGHGGGGRGGGGFHGGAGVRGGGGWHGGTWHGGHGGFHGGTHWHGGHWGGGWGWWWPGVAVGAALAAPYWWGYPYYPYGGYYGYPYYGYPYAGYPYPSYPSYSSVSVESSPQSYVQRDYQAQQYWYYCPGAQAYYPYVKECPNGWQQVLPQPSQPSPVSPPVEAPR